MKTSSKLTRQNVGFLGALACLVLAGSVLAFAVKPPQVSRDETIRTFTGQCCFLWGDTVTVKEPATLVPVILTWTSDYFTSKSSPTFGVGLSVNGGPCTFYGSIALAPVGFLITTHQWVVLPSDGLVKGSNTFAVCGGGTQATDEITVNYTSLAARTGN